MSGKWIWVDQKPQIRRRKAGGSRKGIKTTHRAPRWKRELIAAKKGVIRTVRFVLMAAGSVALLIVILNWLGGG